MLVVVISIIIIIIIIIITLEILFRLNWNNTPKTDV